MGASAWLYFVPYEADADAALAKLRWDLFRKLAKKSHSAEPKAKRPKLTFEQFLPPGVAEDFAEFPEEEAQWREMYEREVLGKKRRDAPTTPDELLEQA